MDKNQLKMKLEVVDDMKEEFTEVKFTINIPFDKPNKNGSMFTKEAVDNAVKNIPENIPIIYRSNESEFSNKVIGATTGNPKVIAWDSENQVCEMTFDGVVFHSGADIIVNEIEDGKITDFRITSIGLTT